MNKLLTLLMLISCTSLFSQKTTVVDKYILSYHNNIYNIESDKYCTNVKIEIPLAYNLYMNENELNHFKQSLSEAMNVYVKYRSIANKNNVVDYNKKLNINILTFLNDKYNAVKYLVFYFYVNKEGSSYLVLRSDTSKTFDINAVSYKSNAMVFSSRKEIADLLNKLDKNIISAFYEKYYRVYDIENVVCVDSFINDGIYNKLYSIQDNSGNYSMSIKINSEYHFILNQYNTENFKKFLEKGKTVYASLTSANTVNTIK